MIAYTNNLVNTHCLEMQIAHVLGYFQDFSKKFLLPLQNMIRADLFSGSLVVWSVRGGAAHFAPPHPSRALRGEGRIPFELFLKYTASRDFASFEKKPRGGEAAARQRFGARSLKTKTIYQLRAKEIF